MFVPRYSRTEAEAAVVIATSYSETLRFLGLCQTGGNWKVLKRWIAEWSIPTEHFEPFGHPRRRRYTGRPIEELLVEGATGSRGTLKARLYREDLKQRMCEACGQGEDWRGARMALILDHVNGVSNDNRLENLRILCPNCAATLDTHCGRKNALPKDPIACLRCGTPFLPDSTARRYCSRACGQRAVRPYKGVAREGQRHVLRPPYAQLLDEISALGYSAVGRKYGVSDNAIRKWVRQYERERERPA